MIYNLREIVSPKGEYEGEITLNHLKFNLIYYLLQCSTKHILISPKKQSVGVYF